MGIERRCDRRQHFLLAFDLPPIRAADVVDLHVLGEEVTQQVDVGGIDSAPVLVLDLLDQFDVFESQRHAGTPSVEWDGIQGDVATGCSRCTLRSPDRFISMRRSLKRHEPSTRTKRSLFVQAITGCRGNSSVAWNTTT